MSHNNQQPEQWPEQVETFFHIKHYLLQGWFWSRSGSSKSINWQKFLCFLVSTVAFFNVTLPLTFFWLFGISTVA